ncbi:MAG: HNH endonuclease [Actinomycetota bacterium]
MGARAGQLAERGTGPPADELLMADGAVRARTARAESRRADVVRWVPALPPLVAAGLVGPDHLDAIDAALRPLSDDERAVLDDAHLAAEAARLPVDTFAAAVRRMVRDALPDHPPNDAESKRADSEFRHWFDDHTGMGCFRGRLDPERYEQLTTAIDRHTAALANSADGPTARNANLAAAALVDLITNGVADGRRGSSAQIIVVVGDRCEPQTSAGHELTDAAVARLACDALVRRVTLDARGVPLDVGRAHRTATDAQWAAIRAIQHRCAWHGCDTRIDWCQLHHIVPWSHGGRTDLDNLVPLCSRHHHRVHEGGWSIRLLDDRSLRIIRPDGVHHTTTDPPRRSPPAAATTHRRMAVRC